MSFVHRFLRLESGTGREDWLVLSATAAALTTFLGLWLSSGGADHFITGLRYVITDAVDNIGRDVPAESAEPVQTREKP